MQFTLKLAFIIAYLHETLSQTCRLQNTEYNLLTIVAGETFRLPLNEYFLGDGLTYTVTPTTSPFTLKTVVEGQGTIQGTIISSTSSYFNNNPNIQGIYYYALTQITGGGYQIYQSQLPTGAPYTQISYNTNFATISQGPTCYSINFIQNMIVVTCINSGTNQLVYIFYSATGGPQMKQLFNQTIDSNTITTGAQISTQAVGQYIVTQVNTGKFNNQTSYSSSQTYLYANQLTYSNLQTYNLNPIILPAILSTSGQTDYYTGISLQENGILFVSTFYNGFAYLNLQNLQTIVNTFNPFNSGTLGVSSYSVDYSSTLFYLAIWSAEGIVAGVYNSANAIPFKSAQVIQTSQITVGQMFTTQIFMNPRFLIAVNFNGISVYPSILNDINNWQLLYFINLNVSSSAFDYYNNILVTVSGQNVNTYQFNNPILTTSNLPSDEAALNITITATTNMYGGTNQQNCPPLILYYNVTSDLQTTEIFQAYQVNSAKETFVQSGPLFNLYLGSIQNVNINKMLIGPAILAGSPTTNQAQSNIDIQFSNVLSTPSINSPYRINSNLIVGQKILYSQMFYDASYIVNDKTGEQFKDTYLQLVQVSNFIVLFQCQGLEDQPCTQILNIPIDITLVEQFALSFSSNSLINIAYMWNEVNAKDKMLVTHVKICQLTYPSTTINSNCQQPNIGNVQGLQISLSQDSFYILYQQTVAIVTTNYFSAFNVQEFFSQAQMLNYDITTFQSYCQYQNPNNLVITSYTQNIPAYGNVIFLNTYSTNIIDISVNYYYFVTALNYNGGYLNLNQQYQYQLEEIGSVQTNDDTTSPLTNYYQFTVDGMYLLTITSKGASSTLKFYPRVDLLPSLFLATKYSQDLKKIIVFNLIYYQQNCLQQPPPKLPINGITLQLYGISNIVQLAASARFLYIMGQPVGSNTYSIYVYKNTPSSQNALYYVISTNANDQIINAPFSVTSAIQYDGILFKSRGNDGYRNSLLLPEFEFAVKCNLNSNFQEQIEYSYVIFRAASQLKNTKLPQTAQQYWATFESVNLISFSKETSTQADAGFISTSGFIQVDPRTYFQGNIQSFLLSNGTNSTTFYYFNITSPVMKQPQTTNYQYPVTAVSANMQISQKQTEQNQYWFTFVQTDRLVYVTPYFYYNPPQDFVDNSTVKIDYPLIYKLPVLDIAPNSQRCPLIFVDPQSKGVVSVCGTKINNKFAASFTLFNTNTQQVLETKIIMLDQAFPILGSAGLTNNGSYQLQSATYLDIGVVVLQFQYTYNFGSSPPTIIILPFLYTSNLNIKIANYDTNTNVYFYQFIQPIQQVYQVKGSNLGSEISVTVFSLTTDYFGGLNNSTADTNLNSQIMFGLLCVSNTKEECIEPYSSTTQNQISSSGVVITVNPGTTLSQVFSTNTTVSYTLPNNLISSTLTTPFQISLFNIVSDYTQSSVQQVIQAGSPIIQFNNAISEVPLIAVSQGTAYVFKLQFYLNNGQYIQSLYACTLVGLSNQNRILQISASSSNTGQYQVVAIVANPTASVNNQIMFLKSYRSDDYLINYNAVTTTPPTILQDGLEVLVTAIGSTTYVSAEATPILALMQPSTSSEIARTLISNNQVITLLDTSPYLTISAYPNYELKGGVSLNSTGLFSNITELLLTSISAQSIPTYINNQLISGEGGSTLFQLNVSQIPTNDKFPNSVWDRKLWGQFIWGSIMFIAILGIIGYLFYKSQPLPYDRF